MQQHSRTASYQPMLIPTSSHSRRPSEPMAPWLSRTPTPNPQPSKPVKISDPKVARSIDFLPPSGKLGLGATVVRTPDEALRDTGVRLTYQADKTLKHKSRTKRAAPLSPPTSPPLPPLPLPEEDEERKLAGEPFFKVITSLPSRPVLPASAAELQRTPSKRPSLKLPRAISVTHSSSSSEDPPSVPPLPSHVAASTQPPPFSPVLVTQPSVPSAAAVNPERVIVTLETCTQTYRTTLSTLTSRQSHLAKYFSTLYPSPPSPTENGISSSVSTPSSVYSTQSDQVGAAYRQHLTSQGVLPLTSTVHIFLDRPSAPYAHILSYLRQPLIDAQPESLPYALQLRNYTSSSIQASSPSLLQSKLDTLVEVRDEAAYLSLEGLQRLCVEEIRNRYNSKQPLMMQLQGQVQGHHMRGLSSSSMQSLHSLQASIYSLHPLQEKAEEDASPDAVLNSNSTSSTSQSPLLSSSSVFNNLSSGPSSAAIAIRKSKLGLAPPSTPSEAIVSRSPPTPRSMEGQSQPNRSRSSSRSRPAPPAGWI